MRQVPKVLAALSALTIAVRPALSEEPDRLAASVRLDVQMVSVSLADAERMVPALAHRNTADTAWAELQQMIARDDATLLSWPILWIQSSVSGWSGSSTESVEELRYPTEFNPPQFPTVFAPSPLIFPNWGTSSPTAFDSRCVGATFEAHAVVGLGGQVVALDFSSQLERLEGFRIWHTQRSPLGIEGIGQLPIFQAAKMSTQLQIHRDQPMLVGVFVFSKPRPHVELHILRARVKLLPSSAVTPRPQ